MFLSLAPLTRLSQFTLQCLIIWDSTVKVNWDVSINKDKRQRNKKNEQIKKSSACASSAGDSEESVPMCHAYIVGIYTKIPTNLGSNARSASSGCMWAVQELIRRPAVLHVNFAISLRLFNIS